MSNSKNVTTLLMVVKRANTPFKAQKKESASLSDAHKTQPGAMARFQMIENYARGTKKLNVLNQQLKSAQMDAAQIQQSGLSTPKQTRKINRAYQRINRLQQKRDSVDNDVKQNKAALKSSGINHQKLGEEKSKLHEQQKNSAESLSAIGDASLKFAKMGFNVGKKILVTGYEQSQKRDNASIEENQAAKSVESGSAVGNSQQNLNVTNVNILQMPSPAISARRADATGARIASLRSNAAALNAHQGSSTDSGLQIVQSSYQTLNVAGNANSRGQEDSGKHHSAAAKSKPAGEYPAVQVIQSASQMLGAGSVRPRGLENRGGNASGTANVQRMAAKSALQSTYQVLNTSDFLRAQGSAAAPCCPAASANAQGNGTRSALQIIQTSNQTLSITHPLSGQANQNSAAAGAAPKTAAGSPGDNLGGDLQKLEEAWQTLSLDIFSQHESSLRSLVQTATSYLGKLQAWVQNNQTLAQTFGIIATVVVGVAGAIGFVASAVAPVITGMGTLISIATTIGSVFSTVFGAVMTVIGSLTLPIVGVIAAFAGAALLIYKFWEPISAFFSGMIDGIIIAFGPIADLFTPFKPVFDGIGKALGFVKDLFSDLISPIKFSKETLESCGNAGKMFGQLIVEALTLPLAPLKKIMEGIDWLLVKIGIVKEKSALDASKTSENSPTAGGAVFGVDAITNLNQYQAAKPAAGRTFTDNSQTAYNITFNGDASPGSDNHRHLQDLLAKQEYDRRSNALSYFSPTGGILA